MYQKGGDAEDDDVRLVPREPAADALGEIVRGPGRAHGGFDGFPEGRLEDPRAHSGSEVLLGKPGEDVVARSKAQHPHRDDATR